MKTSALLLLMLSFQVLGEEIFSDKEKTRPLVHCPKRPCQAEKIIIRNYQSNWNNGENPSSGICRHLEGKAEVGYLKDGSEIAICKFHDGSSALGWDLVRKWRKTGKEI